MNTNRGASTNKKSLAEIFRCFICMEKLRDAHMCPHCSKLCCYPCIHRWLTETRNQCPHCRSALHIQDVVNCRWAEEVTQQLDSLQQNPPAKKRNAAMSLLDTDVDTERCSTHLREELSVYCSSCKCCICHECALWSSAHTGHTFKPLDEIYNMHCQQIKEQVTRLRRKFMELISSVQDVEKNIEFIRTAKDQRVREIRNAVELMIARLDAHLKTKLMTLVNQKSHLARKSEDVETLLREIENQLSSGPKSELIKQSAKLLKTIEDSISKSTFSLAPVLADFQSELVPSYDFSYFIVNKFSQARSKADAFYSEPLQVHGLSWRLKVYPDGNGVVRGTYLSVFLELTGGPAEPAKYEYRIEMIYQASNDPTKNMMREFASDFEVGECWGYNRFFRLDLLEPEGYLDTVTDSIKLRFDVRPPTYYQKCKDQQWYISHLLATGATQSAKVEELKERLELLEGDANALSDEAHSPDRRLTRDTDDQDIREKSTEQLIAAYECQSRSRRITVPSNVVCGELELEIGNESDESDEWPEYSFPGADENDVDDEVQTTDIDKDLRGPRILEARVRPRDELRLSDLRVGSVSSVSCRGRIDDVMNSVLSESPVVLPGRSGPSSGSRIVEVGSESYNLGNAESEERAAPVTSSSSNYFNLLDELQFVGSSSDTSTRAIPETNPTNNSVAQNNQPEAVADTSNRNQETNLTLPLSDAAPSSEISPQDMANLVSLNQVAGRPEILYNAADGTFHEFRFPDLRNSIYNVGQLKSYLPK